MARACWYTTIPYGDVPMSLPSPRRRVPDRAAATLLRHCSRGLRSVARRFQFNRSISPAPCSCLMLESAADRTDPRSRSGDYRSLVTRRVAGSGMREMARWKRSQPRHMVTAVPIRDVHAGARRVQDRANAHDDSSRRRPTRRSRTSSRAGQAASQRGTTDADGSRQPPAAPASAGDGGVLAAGLKSTRGTVHLGHKANFADAIS